MKKSLVLFVSIITISATIGCTSAKNSIRNASAESSTLVPYKTVNLAVSSKVEKSDAEVKSLEAALAKKLKETGKWSIVEKGEVAVSVSITDLRKVSRGKRVMLGLMAGAAKTVADVSIADAKGKVLRSFTVEGVSSNGSIFSGTTEEAIEMAAAKIAEEMGK